MKRHHFFLAFLLLTVAPCFTGCESMSTDPAPGGIRDTATGMNAASIQEWQDRTIRQLAY